MQTTPSTSASWGWIASILGAGIVGALVSQFGSAPMHAEATPSPTTAELQNSLSTEQSRILLDQSARVFERVAQLVSPAVVYIEAKRFDPDTRESTEESGSGVLVRPREFGRAVIVTNLHVVEAAKSADIQVYLADGQRIPIQRVWADPDTDLAVLDPGEKDLPAVILGDSERVRVGQWTLVIGSPFGLVQSVTHGIISAKQRRQVGLPNSVRMKEFLQTDAAINPGNSGGPLVNLEGEVIGINTAIASKTGSSSGVGFAIPANIVRWVVEELVMHGEVRRSFLGVQFAPVFDAAKAESLGLPFPRGALVGQVHRNTPAAKAGVQAGDVILEFDDRPIEDEFHLINLVSQTPVGSRIKIVVWRDGKRAERFAVLSSWNDYRASVKP